jgi:uncharacterized cupredoxin-like copper-binding protein
VSSLRTSLVTSAGVALAALTLGSCADSSSGVGPGMMRSASGMHYRARTCAPPASLPGAVVRVTLADMGMTRMMGGTAPRSAHMVLTSDRATVPAGTVSIEASNLGWRTHELVIRPLADGAVAGRRTPDAKGEVDEAGSLAEASSSCAVGSGSGITSGAVGWVTLTLPRGRYELLCNLPNHYADGMYAELVVN